LKRFTETKKWSDPWFRKLEPRMKCLWCYLLDTCDNAGIISIDWDLASFVIGETVTPDDLAAFDGRLEDIGNGNHWLPKFVRYQYKTLSDHNPATRHVLDILRKHGLEGRACQGPSKGLGRGYQVSR
jgi:hypothetical protein